MNIKEAIYHAKSIGKHEIKEILAEKLWPSSNSKQQMLNINNLVAGRVNSIKTSHVAIICEECEIDANFLFNVKPITQK